MIYFEELPKIAELPTWQSMLLASRELLARAGGLHYVGGIHRQKDVRGLAAELPYLWQFDFSREGHPLVLCGREYKPLGVQGSGFCPWVKYADYPRHCIQSIDELPASARERLHYVEGVGYYFYDSYRCPPWRGKTYARRLAETIDAHFRMFEGVPMSTALSVWL
ncbi:MAG: hypothetical protein JJ714_03655 [Acidithiobacillus sp.]|nr:hypothetical protein [Acidithiobacillus sp.]